MHRGSYSHLLVWLYLYMCVFDLVAAKLWSLARLAPETLLIQIVEPVWCVCGHVIITWWQTSHTFHDSFSFPHFWDSS